MSGHNGGGLDLDQRARLDEILHDDHRHRREVTSYDLSRTQVRRDSLQAVARSGTPARQPARLRASLTTDPTKLAAASSEAERLAGVGSAAIARITIVTGDGRVMGLLVEGRPGYPDEFVFAQGAGVVTGDPTQVNANVVGPGFFRTLPNPRAATRPCGVYNLDSPGFSSAPQVPDR